MVEDPKPWGVYYTRRDIAVGSDSSGNPRLRVYPARGAKPEIGNCLDIRLGPDAARWLGRGLLLAAATQDGHPPFRAEDVVAFDEPGGYDPRPAHPPPSLSVFEEIAAHEAKMRAELAAHAQWMLGANERRGA